uniref:SAM domain-containing protein n=1 Tax=Dolomedes sulfureus TaxID=492288 RepID=A0A0P0DMI4_9ARAC|nr:SAM domain-containing protein [Dolomedes sulfureus]
MMKFSLCVLTIGVLLGGAAADFLCILQQLVIVTPDHFFTDPAAACRDVDTKFDRVRKDLKKCTRHEIDMSLLETLHKEFCDPTSNYRQKFNREERCLVGNIPNIRSCLENMSVSPGAILGGTMTDMCRSLSDDTSNCLIEKVGRPCGARGLEVYQRITTASAPFFTGICLEAAGVHAPDSGTDKEAEDEVHETEEGFVEVGVAEAAVAEGVGSDAECDHHYHASAVVNFAYSWCIVLGVLLAWGW